MGILAIAFALWLAMVVFMVAQLLKAKVADE